MSQSAAEKYREAVELYRTTDLTLAEISSRCNVSSRGLAAYIYRCRRDLMLRRRGIEGSPEVRLHSNTGQRPATREKYRCAIEACDSEDYIRLNVSEIARMFHLGATALANQLRAHYPDILPRREAERRKRGIADNLPRGVKKYAKEEYAAAVELLRNSDMTVEEAARSCNVSPSGLKQHVLFYHKDITLRRARKRADGRKSLRPGTVTGSGHVRKETSDTARKYAEGVKLYSTTSMPVAEIAEQLGVNEHTLRNYLVTWHPRLVEKRRKATPDGDGRFRLATAEKYADAIAELKSSEISVEAVAKKYGFTPEVLRAYLKVHEPELHDSLGMTTLPNGRLVLKRSYEKYREAVEAFSAGTDSLKAIAEKYGLTYNSLGGFIRRNMPELLARRKSQK